jgi:hypothetical protein
MGLKVMNGDEGQAMGKCDRLRRDKTNDETADQTRPGGRRNGIEIGKAHSRLAHGLSRQEIEAFYVRARGYFRHHTAIGAVAFPLRTHNIGEDTALAIAPAHNDGGGRLVAARFQPEHKATFSAIFVGAIHELFQRTRVCLPSAAQALMAPH